MNTIKLHLHHVAKKNGQHTSIPCSTIHLTYLVYPIDIRDNRILVKTNIGNRDLQFVIDYAAETNIIDGRLPDKILDSVEISGRIDTNRSRIKKIEALTGDLSSLQVRRLYIKRLPVLITNTENTCFGGMDCINGVLGYDFTVAL